MGKLSEDLIKQLGTDLKQDAEDCIKIIDCLQNINNGSVWSSQWSILTQVKFKGFPSSERIYKPSPIGYIFLKGIDSILSEQKEKENEKENS